MTVAPIEDEPKAVRCSLERALVAVRLDGAMLDLVATLQAFMRLKPEEACAGQHAALCRRAEIEIVRFDRAFAEAIAGGLAQHEKGGEHDLAVGRRAPPDGTQHSGTQGPAHRVCGGGVAGCATN